MQLPDQNVFEMKGDFNQMERHLILETESKNKFRVNGKGQISKYDDPHFSEGWTLTGLVSVRGQGFIPFASINYDTLLANKLTLQYMTSKGHFQMLTQVRGRTFTLGDGVRLAHYDRYLSPIV